MSYYKRNRIKNVILQKNGIKNVILQKNGIKNFHGDNY